MKTSIELFKSKRFISKRKRCDWKWEIFSWVGSNRLLPKTIFFQNWNHTQYTLKVSFLWIYSLMSLNFVVVVPFCGSKTRKIDQLYLICYMCMLNFGSEKASNMTLNYRTNEKKNTIMSMISSYVWLLLYIFGWIFERKKIHCRKFIPIMFGLTFEGVDINAILRL